VINYSRIKNINPISTVRKGTIETFENINELEMMTEIEYAIMMLKHYKDSGSFSLIAIHTDQYSRDVSD